MILKQEVIIVESIYSFQESCKDGYNQCENITKSKSLRSFAPGTSNLLPLPNLTPTATPPNSRLNQEFDHVAEYNPEVVRASNWTKAEALRQLQWQRWNCQPKLSARSTITSSPPNSIMAKVHSVFLIGKKTFCLRRNKSVQNDSMIN